MGGALSRRIAGRLDRGLQKARSQMEQDALKSVHQKSHLKYSDPNAVHGGFERGQGPDLLADMQQEEFLKNKSKGKESIEMPDDLIKFLNDVGPLQRKLDRDLTSPRLREKMQLELEQRRDEEDVRRTQRDMPILKDSGFTASRTTNFSSAKGMGNESEKDPTGLTDLGIFEILLSEKNPNETIEQSMLTFDQPARTILEEEERKTKVELMRHTLHFLGSPVIMKDTDETYVGTWKEKLPDMKHARLKEVTEDRVRLTLSAERAEKKTSSEKNNNGGNQEKTLEM